MFGYVRARKDTMPEGAWENYEAVYCGLCHTLKEQYGQRARLFLNYDFALLAMLLAPADAMRVSDCRRCFLHPVHGKPACTGGSWLEFVAAESMVLTYWKLQDAVADEKGPSQLGGRGLRLWLKRAYERARAVCPAFDEQVSTRLKELRELEQAGCASLDRVADHFACILRSAAPETGETGRDRAMGELLYHLGRWIYLIDAVDDLAEDSRQGRYNPVAVRFPKWSQEDREYLRRSMDHSLALAGAAFQLLADNAWTPVTENILYDGLPSVEELVFSGKWKEQQKKHRREHP